MSKLHGLSELERLPALQTLHCQRCPRLESYEGLATLQHLHSLRLNACAEIPSLAFLDRMPQLTEFRFVGTNVVDGNLSPLLRLTHVGFLNKRHYSHTDTQLDAVLRAKGGSAIPRIGDSAPQTD